jgi:hypothetical protein
MGAIVRLLPRLFLLGLAAGALLVLADRARDAHAQAPHPPTAPPALSPPRVPDAPDTPDVDAGTVTGAVGALPAVPTVAPPEPLLPQLPELPQLPDVPGLPDVPQVPEVPELPAPRQAPDGVLGLSAAPAPIAPSPSAAPRRPSSAPEAEPPPAGVASTEASGVPAGLDTDVVAARAPPRVTPSRHPCPDGETSEPTDADQAACLASGVDDANRGGESFDEPCSRASALLRDPLLRPD